MFKKSVDVFLYDDYWHDLTWLWLSHNVAWLHWYIYLQVLYDNIYEGFYPCFTGFHSRFYDDDFVAMRPLWTNLWRGRIWAWLMLWCAFVVGGVASVLTTTDLGEWGCHGVIPWLSQANTSVGLVIWYLMILKY